MEASLEHARCRTGNMLETRLELCRQVLLLFSSLHSLLAGGQSGMLHLQLRWGGRHRRVPQRRVQVSLGDHLTAGT